MGPAATGSIFKNAGWQAFARASAAGVSGYQHRQRHDARDNDDRGDDCQDKQPSRDFAPSVRATKHVTSVLHSLAV